MINEPKYENAYVGKSYSYIISSLGAPMRTTPDGNGGTILIYEYFSDESNGYVTNYGYIFSKTSRDVQYLHLYMNKNNICYATKSRFKYTEKDTGGAIACALGVVGALFLISAANFF
jgi:hypothetical protein